jgi:hypothetical protein
LCSGCLQVLEFVWHGWCLLASTELRQKPSFFFLCFGVINIAWHFPSAMKSEMPRLFLLYSSKKIDLFFLISNFFLIKFFFQFHHLILDYYVLDFIICFDGVIPISWSESRVLRVSRVDLSHFLIKLFFNSIIQHWVNWKLSFIIVF